ncbi:MAG TPA: translation initiation factor IF-2, partial [Usitatibacter sp.]|nr:translation initiation factor IF-2 [Usitatibacter sp.]
MAKSNVTQFAEELKLPVALLLEQLHAAGVKKSAGDDAITEHDKTRLLDYLREMHGNKEEKKKITLTRKQTTEIKKADATGKARTIQVEVRKKRTFVKVDKPEAPPEPPKPVVAPAPIIDEEEARKREAEAKRQAELAARQAAEAESKAKRAIKKKADETAEAKPPEATPAEGEAPKKKRVVRKKDEEPASEAEAPVLVEVKAEAAKAETPAAAGTAVPAAPSEGTLHRPVLKPGESKDKKGPKRTAKPASSWVDDQNRRRGIKTRGDASGGRDGWRARGHGRHRDDEGGTTFAAPSEPKILEVLVPETITVGDLAHKMSVKAAEVIKVMMKMGSMVTINQVLDQDTAMIVVQEMGHQAKPAKLDDPESFLAEAAAASEETLETRPPVVTVTGHVDHGKTSLLDYIRKANVVAGESGGITQHIGAYNVQLPDGRRIAFLDTPGHEAFTAMRARGAQVTDIVILVVAADDAIMPQTVEAISHAKNAGVPMIVAINKIDLPAADVDKVRRDLLQHQVILEEFGGTTLAQPISAKTGKGVPELLEQILLQADLLELKANPDKPAAGSVVEAQLDPGKGPVATVLVTNGTLRVGDNFICGAFSGRVRALQDERGRAVKEAGPSTPVQVLGFEGVPQAGDTFS